MAFGNRKLKGAETRYTVMEQECLVVFDLRKWRDYLHVGPRFEIVDDHIAFAVADVVAGAAMMSRKMDGGDTGVRVRFNSFPWTKHFRP
jgi:acyl-coenzyme A thioesterase PaaI-like protein